MRGFFYFKMKKNSLILLIFFYFSTHFLYAENDIKLYFYNDSINGFKPSDAYETHNMGLIYNFNNNFFRIDLGIVSPDMFQYENQYRQANRSYGELIKINYGTNNVNNMDLTLYLNFISQGKFGINKLQNFVHSIANFQNEDEILKEVRMPNGNWIGAGIRYKNNYDILDRFNSKLIYDAYVGTDNTEFKISSENDVYNNKNSNLKILSSISYKPYDNIVSAEPVNAVHRQVIPSIGIIYIRKFEKFNIEISENISLPTISSDNEPYIRLGGSIVFPLQNLLK